MAERPVFIELTRIEDDDQQHPVLVSLRAVSHIQPCEGGCIIFFSALEPDDCITVTESYATIITMLGKEDA